MTRLTENDARRALAEHLVEKAVHAKERYGPRIDMQAMLRILADPEFVRYPTHLYFDDADLEPGEFGYAVRLGEHPSEGFRLIIHPCFEARSDVLPLLIAYHLPPINYGDIASPDDCERFGAALFGLDVDVYYRTLCALADAMPTALKDGP